MKQGKTLTQLAEEVERQAAVKKDFVADTRALAMFRDGKQVSMNGQLFGLTSNAKRQIASKLGIPFEYYGRLEEKHPELLATNVNQLMDREPSRNMVRTLDGNIRAFLSDRYRPLDNFDLLDAILPAIRDSKAIPESCEVTENKMYIKLRMPWLDRELPVPEGLKMGVGHTFFVRKVEGSVVITNSEVGSGALAIAPAVFERQCTNLAVFKDEGFGRMHIGGKAGGDEAVTQYLTDETKRIKDAAIWGEARDVIKAVMDGRAMENIIAKLTEARGDAITGDPTKVIEVFGKKNGLNEAERGGLLKHLVGSGEMTRYGLQWAVTRLAGEVESYDRASELERLGGAVIELPKTDWTMLAKAA
jgi:hypothetical protein